ncbi:hypothetical protein FGO68_gene7120 [Halteria grandinella]|uniref:MAPEG family protein n=1 Tax=Halteria grandinella TaxID=5974 RepID=A0A8J8SYD7_HALGN|nr:hypothetical protein FGO68_gene7120 [Halteria grandinella]
MGNGFFADKLSYKAWFDFNNAQRAHYNYLENLTPLLVWHLLGIVYHPLLTAAFGFLCIISRILYTIGYMKTPNSRVLGALLFDVGFLGLFVLGVLGAVKGLRFIH